ncbi:hypothetical protein K488DRAFT_40072, partial [Vararia minispora EC-137]
KDPVRVAAGYKAAMSNPHTSSEAKAHACEQLEQIDPGTEGSSKPVPQDELTTRVLAGYNSTLSNDRVSSEAKVRAAEVLEAAGYQIERPEGTSEDEHMTRVLAGYKAALHNDRVSAEAKAHAREFLTAHCETV